jgi:hypothetical protein
MKTWAMVALWLMAGAVFALESPKPEAVKAREGDVALSPESPSAYVDLEEESLLQFDELVGIIKKPRNPSTNEVFRCESLILKGDRDPVDVVLRRTSALLGDLEGLKRNEKLRGQLDDLFKRCALVDPVNVDARRALFRELCALRRKIAFSNPLLDFSEILFLKRNGIGGQHLCDQNFGAGQLPGGGIYVISDPFGEKPVVRDILTAPVVSGRLSGRLLSKEGSFLSPALSFDGKRIAFSYVEREGDKSFQQMDDPHVGVWAQGMSFHVFSANLDGTDLRMLTDGTWNEISPCFMPSGRIVFLSERRGGFTRCGRCVPSYVLYDMNPDGTDLRCLSFHETNEFSPSVTHAGMLVYTRWDYIDRHGCTAHHPWLTTPDGRNPRQIHGNYTRRGSRPDMESEIRAIPGSSRFVATAAPHHGQSFGSLIVIDPNVSDEVKPMAPVKRLTPHIVFPESQGGIGAAEAFGQAWPLSEKYYLCAKRGKEKGTDKAGKFAIYLIDAFGNWDLICRDPALNCLSPIPVKSQKIPPVLSDMSVRVPADKEAEAVVGVLNVYDSYKPFPSGTKIKALRIYQLFPCSVPEQRTFHATGMRIPQAYDSINLARAVLGTVPVEEDGSAYFTAPARKLLYFQVLDEKGLAVTSMRSAAYFQPGERAVCQGCHEPKLSSPVSRKGKEKAFKRAPSRIQADVDGTNPFSYPRLVQPVLDRNCVACHEKNAGKAPPLDRKIVRRTPRGYMDPETDYFASYMSLAPKYGFFSYPDETRSTPGQFGARVSKLYEMLDKGHHDVKLSQEDMHRVTVWLDSVSLFYGVYEKEGGKAQLRGEIVKPTLE